MNVETLSEVIISAFKNGNKLLICGNGGSACMASHFAGELVGKFKLERKALPAISLNDPGMITAIGNDYGFDHVFERQVGAYGKPGDVLVTLSTSGKSRNVMLAQLKAKELKMEVIIFPTIVELQNNMPTHHWDTASAQEEHLGMIHDICEEVEEAFVIKIKPTKSYFASMDHLRKFAFKK